MDIEDMKRDSKEVAAGRWIDDIPGAGDLRLKVRGMTSPFVVAIRSRKERLVPKSDRERDGMIKPDVAVRIFGETLAEAVLITWENLTTGKDKQEIPYSKEAAMRFCTDPDFSQFADAVFYAAQVVDRGNKDAQDGLEKNLSTTSPGISNGEAAGLTS